MGATPSAAPAELWEPVAKIGKGMFGSVLAVRRRGSGPSGAPTELRAMKAISKRSVIDHKAVSGTLREMKIMAGLAPCRFVVRLRQAFQDKGCLYLVTELCAGGSVDDLVRKERKLDPRAARFLFAELVLALEHLHKCGVVHMDVKLANCLLTLTGHLRLGDFNGAVEWPSARSRFSGKAYFGTSGYTSPEVLIMETDFVVTSPDWWSAGACLFTMLHGKRASPWTTQRRRFATWEDELEVIVRARHPRIGHLVDPRAAALIRALLRLDWRKRLGCSARDAAEVKGHAYFTTLDWELLAAGRLQPPLRPGDTCALPGEAERKRGLEEWSMERLRARLLGSELAEEDQLQFKDWKFERGHVREPSGRPAFALLDRVAAMSAKEARAYIARQSDDAVTSLLNDIRELRELWAEENKELAVCENVKAMLSGENAQLKDIIRDLTKGTTRVVSGRQTSGRSVDSKKKTSTVQVAEHSKSKSPKLQAEPPSNTLVLRGMLPEEGQGQQDDFCSNIATDIKGECAKFGEVVSVKMCTQDRTVTIKFDSTATAARAQASLHGRHYQGRPVVANFVGPTRDLVAC